MKISMGIIKVLWPTVIGLSRVVVIDVALAKHLGSEARFNHLVVVSISYDMGVTPDRHVDKILTSQREEFYGWAFNFQFLKT